MIIEFQYNDDKGTIFLESTEECIIIMHSGPLMNCRVSFFDIREGNLTQAVDKAIAEYFSNNYC